MKTKIALLALALSASTGLLMAQDAPPAGDAPRPPGAEASQHGPRGGFHVLPPGAAEKLQLTDDQKAQIAGLEAEVKAKMEKILTTDQLAKLKKFHPQQRPQRGGGGPGGGPGDDHRGGPEGDQGGPGGPGGPDGGGNPPPPNQ